MRNLTPSGASRENPAPRPLTTSIVRWVCRQYTYWLRLIHTGTTNASPSTGPSSPGTPSSGTPTTSSPSRTSASPVRNSPAG